MTKTEEKFNTIVLFICTNSKKKEKGHNMKEELWLNLIPS